MRKMLTGWALMLIGLTLMTAGTTLAHQAAAQQAALPPDLIRLHVIANSDSAADQAVKLRVRDAIVAELAPQFAEVADPAESEAALTAALPLMEQVAQEVLAAEGFDYGARAELGWFEFPVKVDDQGNTLPAGRYKAVRVVLGEGAGANWWCIVAPALCFRSWVEAKVYVPAVGEGEPDRCRSPF